MLRAIPVPLNCNYLSTAQQRDVWDQMACGLQKSFNRASKKCCVGPSSFLLDNSAWVLPLLLWTTTWCQTVPGCPSDVQTDPLASGLGTKSSGGCRIALRSSGSSALRCSFRNRSSRLQRGAWILQSCELQLGDLLFRQQFDFRSDKVQHEIAHVHSLQWLKGKYFTAKGREVMKDSLCLSEQIF